jgi:hypothetical protein
MLSGGHTPSDALRFGPQDLFFAALRDMCPPGTTGHIMWKTVMQLVLHYNEFELSGVRTAICTLPLF